MYALPNYIEQKILPNLFQRSQERELVYEIPKSNLVKTYTYVGICVFTCVHVFLKCYQRVGESYYCIKN